MLRAIALVTLASVFLFVSSALAAPVRAGADDSWRAEQERQRSDALWRAAGAGGWLDASLPATPELGDSLAGLLTRRLAPRGFGATAGLPGPAHLTSFDLDLGGDAQADATEASPRQSEAEKELEIRDSVGATASELAQSLVRQRVKLKRNKRALGAGVAGLIFGPVAIVGGLVLILTIIGFIAGVILVVVGAVSTALGIPLIIGGAIGATAARNRIDVLEEKLEMKGELWEPRAEPLFELAFRF